MLVLVNTGQGLPSQRTQNQLPEESWQQEASSLYLHWHGEQY